MMAVGTERKSTGTFTQPEGRREGGREGTSPHSNQNDLQIPATQTGWWEEGANTQHRDLLLRHEEGNRNIMPWCRPTRRDKRGQGTLPKKNIKKKEEGSTQ